MRSIVCEYALNNLETLIAMFGDRVQATSLPPARILARRTACLFPRNPIAACSNRITKKLNELIHRKSNWKIFIHSCGAVAPHIPEFIEAGFDILNLVQCSAAGMDAVALKRNFGKDMTFWGGSVNTQHTMYQTPDDVYREVCERIDIFNQDSGFVCNAVHKRGNSPIENVLAMFRRSRTAQNKIKLCPLPPPAIFV